MTTANPSKPATALGTNAEQPLVKSGDAAATAPRKALTTDEIVRRLTGVPNRVAEQLFKVVEGQVASETARQQRIDAKATSLLAAVALSLTVAFTFGAILLKDGWSLWPGWLHLLVLGAFALALVFGFTAAVFALKALLVTAYPGMNEDAIFNEDILARAKEEAADIGQAPDDDAAKLAAKTAAAEATALAQYQMSMTMQLWAMVCGIRQNHARKTKALERGQQALIAFLVCVGVLFVLICVAAYLYHPPPPPRAP